MGIEDDESAEMDWGQVLRERDLVNRLGESSRKGPYGSSTIVVKLSLGCKTHSAHKVLFESLIHK